MKPKFCFDNSFAKLLKVNAIVLYPFVLFAQPKQMVSERLLNHEWVHVRQVRELGWFKFYFLYLKEYFQNLSKHQNPRQAYFAISFEREAYNSEKDLSLSQAEIDEIRSAMKA